MKVSKRVGWAFVVLFLNSAMYAQEGTIPPASSGPGPDAADSAENPFTDPPTLPAAGKTRLQVDSQVYRWSAGEPPVKMLHKSEGFCVLTSVEGKFNAATDRVRIFLGQDDCWYLHGSAEQKGQVSATAVAIRLVGPQDVAAEDVPVASLPSREAATPEAPTTRGPDSGSTPAATPQPTPAKQLVVRLPALIDELCVGGAGAYLVLYFERLQKLAIVDSFQAKIVRFLSVSGHVAFTAGREKLVVLDTGQKLIHRYDLASGERELSVVSPVATPAWVAMGCASDGPVLISSRSDESGSGRLLFADLKSFKPLQLEYTGEGGGGFEQMEVWASADGTTFGLTQRYVSPGGVTVMRLQDGKVITRYNHDSAPYVWPSADGSVVFTGDAVLNQDLQPTGPSRERARVPMMSMPTPLPSQYISLLLDERGGVPEIWLQSLPDHQRLLTLPNLPELRPGEGYGMYSSERSLPFERRLYVLPTQQRLITVPNERDHLIVRKFDLLTELRAADVDFLFISSWPPRVAAKGKPYRYQMQIESRRGGAKAKLDSGPDGMTLSESGLMTWTPSPTFSNAETGVVISVSDASGQEIFHSFVIRVTGP